MEFNKCERCGCFYMADSTVCPKCKPKEIFEMNVLKSYFSNKTLENNSIDKISIDTGISERNLDRFLKSPDFKNLINNDNNLKMNL